jgi:hypothetical protein
MKRKKKKAMGIEDAGMVIYRLVFLTIAIAVFVMFANMLLNPPTNVNRAKAEIYLGRVFYSEPFHYKEPTTQRVYTNIIDVDKLMEMNNTEPNNPQKGITTKLEEYFRNEFYNKNRQNLLVAKINLDINDKTLKFPTNKKQYDLLSPKKSFEGKGAVTAMIRTFYTTCYYEEELIPCKMSLELLIPNS